MHESEISFIPLLIVVALGFLVPVALSPVRRFGIPVIVGEIVAGIVVGQSGLGLVETGRVLEVLSAFGFAYLMFLSGLEMDFSQIPQSRSLHGSSRIGRLVRNPFALGGLMFALTALCSVAAGFYLRHIGVVDGPWLMAMILSTTSLGVVAPVLKERGLLAERYGQTILVCALIADFVTVLLISSFVLFRSEGLSLEMFVVLILVMVFLIVYQLAARFREHVPAQNLMRMLSTATAQIQVRGSLAVALVFIALAESLGAENILGAFLAGVIISLLSGSHSSVLREKLDAIGYGFFIPVFFIMVGVQFDLPALLASGSGLQLVAVLVAIAIAVKLAGGMVFRLAYSWRQTLAASTLLSARLSLIIAVATIGREIGAITPALEAAIILVAIVTCLLSPMLFNRLLPPGPRPRDHILVAGAGADARALVARLRALELDVEAVALREAHAEDEAEGGSSSARLARLREAGINEAGIVVAMAEYDEDNQYVCRLARDIHSVHNVVAWVRDPAHNRRFLDAGAQVINPSTSKLLMLESLILSGEARTLSPDQALSQDVRVVKLRNRWLRDQKLRDLGLPDGVSVLRIERGGEVLIPGLDSSTRANDVFTLAGDAGLVDEVARRLARPW